MKTLLMALVALFIGMGTFVGDAEAKRLGGGKSLGMQRESAKPSAPAAAPTAGATSAPVAQAPATGAAGAAAAAAPKRSWLGPVAGLAAGLGLAALASHFGFGEGLANFMMILLLAMAAFFVFRLIFRRKQAVAPGMQYAGAAPGNVAPRLDSGFSGSAAAPVPAVPPAARIPAGFDVDGFLRQAKLNFIRMQAANDAGNLDDLREFTSPEMYAEIKLAIAERGNTRQQTDVEKIDAAVLEVVEEPARYVVSVHFQGLLREDDEPAAVPFDEIWHLTKPADGSRGWVVAGIQQTH